MLKLSIINNLRRNLTMIENIACMKDIVEFVSDNVKVVVE